MYSIIILGIILLELYGLIIMLGMGTIFLLWYRLIIMPEIIRLESYAQYLRACLATTVPFRWVAISAVKTICSPFWKWRKRVICMGKRNRTVVAKQALSNIWAYLRLLARIRSFDPNGMICNFIFFLQVFSGILSRAQRNLQKYLGRSVTSFCRTVGKNLEQWEYSFINNMTGNNIENTMTPFPARP